MPYILKDPPPKGSKRPEPPKGQGLPKIKAPKPWPDPPVKDEHLQHWGEMYGIDQAYDETDTQFKARLLIKLGVAPRTTGTQDHLEQLRAAIMRDLPVGLRLGPLMVLGVSKRFGGIFTQVAFWLLKRAGWQLTEGGQ